MSKKSSLYSKLRGQSTSPSKALLEFSHFGYMWMDWKTRKIVASHTIYTLLQVPAFSEFLTAEKWKSFVHPDDLFKLVQAEEHLLQTGEQCSVEYRLISRSGRHIWINHLMQLVISDSNEVKISSVIDDITEQKSAELILDVMNEVFFELDDHFVFRRVNAKAELFWKMDRRQLTGHSIWTLFPQTEGSPFRQLIIHAKSTNRHMQQDVLFPGPDRWLHVSVSPYADGIIVIFYDIQNEKEAAQKVKEKEAQWTSLVENASAVVTRWNRDLKLVYANSAFQRKTGVPLEDQYGKDSFEIWQRPEIAGPYSEKLREVLETGEAAVHFNSFPTPEGQVDYFARIVPEKDEHGRVESVLRIAHDITDLRKSEKELQENKVFIQEVTSTVPDYIALHETGSGKLIYANQDSFWDEYNLDPFKKNIYECAARIIHPGEKDRLDQYLAERELLEDGVIKEIELRTVFDRWIRFRSKVFRREANGLPTQVMSVIADITTRKKAELELRESQQLLQSVFDTSLVGMSLFRVVRNEKGDIVDFRIELVNKKIEDATNRKDLVGKLYTQEFPGINKSGLFALMVEVVNTGRSGQMEYYYPYDGFNDWYISMFVKTNDALVATTINITHRKHAEQEQLKHFTLLQQSEELSESGSWEYNMQHGTMRWSAGMYRLFNMPAGTPVTPATYLLFVVPEDRSRAEQLIDAIENSFAPTETTLRIQVNNTVKILRIKAQPASSAEEDTNKMLGIDMDVTAEQRSADKIEQLNKTLTARNRQLASVNSEITTFNSVAANDYQETLRQLYTTLEFLISKDARNLSDAGKANVRRAQSAIQKMKLITDDLVAFSRLHAIDGIMSEVDMNQAVQSVLTELQEKVQQPGIHVQTAPLPVIKGYAQLLSLLLHHLLDNALKFRQKEGETVIRITYEIIGEAPHPAADAPAGPYHCISVADNGVGFDQQEAENVFTIFYRIHQKDKYRGSGIGLAVCKKIMDLHNGFIRANSSPSAGTAIHCFFPVHSEQ